MKIFYRGILLWVDENILSRDTIMGRCEYFIEGYYYGSMRIFYRGTQLMVDENILSRDTINGR